MTTQKIITHYTDVAKDAAEWLHRLFYTPEADADGKVLYLDKPAPLAQGATEPEGGKYPATYAAYIAMVLNIPVPDGIVWLWGFTARGALADLDRYTKGETWYPESFGKKGRLVDMSVNETEKDPTKLTGVSFTDGKTRNVLNTRLGADRITKAPGVEVTDSDQYAKGEDIATVALAHFILAVIGPAPANTKGAQVSPWTGARDAHGKITGVKACELVGFDTSAKDALDRPDRYRLSHDARSRLSRIVRQIGHFPEGSLSAHFLAQAPRNPNMLVVCPTDFDASAGDTVKIPAKERESAIASGKPGAHFRCRMTFAYYAAGALGYCGRDGHKDAEGKKIKGHVPLIMLAETEPDAEGNSKLFPLPNDAEERAEYLASLTDNEPDSPAGAEHPEEQTA